MLEPAYDVIVLGVGGMGSAALFELARRGRRVLGIDQFTPPHNLGSSHGETRVIRKAYFEHPAYVPLAQRAYERWYDLEQRSGKHLLTECGCLAIGPPSGELIAGVRAAASEHGLTIENFETADLRKRFPTFRVPEGAVGVLEPGAGYLMVEACVQAHIDAAHRLGAELRIEERAISWRADGTSVEVETTAGRYRAARLILTAGPWAGQLLARWGAKLRVMRQVLLWFATTDDSAFRRDVFPVYFAETPAGFFYGLPVIDHLGHKVAQHYGAPELLTPEEIQRTVQSADEVPLREFLRAYLPQADGPLRHGQTCIYTLTPDRHFLIDLHPDHANVAVAAGFSGHGFKFASAVGEALADLADTGHTALPIEMFRFARLAT
jgi:sarcosine oxidase